MDRPADFSVADLGSEGRAAVVTLTGDWTVHGLGGAGERLSAAVRNRGEVAMNLADLGRVDSAGAYVLMRAARVGPHSEGLVLRPDAQRLISFISAAVAVPQPPATQGPAGLYAGLVRIGRAVVDLGSELFRTFVFYGRLIAALGRVLAHPRHVRLAPTVSLMERSGLDAMPIVATTSFFVGATLGFLGEDLLQQFGAQVYSVELVGIGVLREFAVLVTAIILAGRSASSFAAEIGAMRMNQEVDAMQVMGVDAFEALVLPRFVALLTMTPLLTFVAMISGLFGGLMVIWMVVGLSPAFFLERLLDNVGVSHFWIGMAKAPVMAMTIASIGCRHGLEVGGDVEQLGRRVTTAVVQALFAVILIDAAFAFLFVNIGL